MVTEIQRQSIPRHMLWLLAGLLAISAALFVIGVTVERSTESSTVHQATGLVKPANSEGGEGHNEANEAHVDQSTPQNAPVQNESFLGIDLENPWLVGLAVLSSVVLIAALLRFGYRILPIIVLFGIAATLFDVGEVVRQIQANKTNIVLLAGLVLLAHAAVVIVSLLSVYKYKNALTQPEAHVPSMSS